MKTIKVQTEQEIESKHAEITAKVAAYQAAQAYQNEHGGPGPVADYEIMDIVNVHGGEFEVVLEEQPVEE